MAVVLRAVIVALLSSLAALAAAQDDVTEADRARALELGSRGIELFNQRRWVDAYLSFDNAEAIVHSPVFVLYMARAKRQLGNLQQAEALYRRVIDETLPDGAPAQWHGAQRDARDELTLLAPLIPRLSIEVSAPPDSVTQLWLDDQPIETTTLSVDPGHHRVSAQCGDGERVSAAVSLSDGEDKTLKLAPPCDAASAAPPLPLPSTLPSAIPMPLRPLRPAAPDPEAGRGLRMAGTVMMVGGGVLLAAGVATGIGALVLDGDLADDCAGGVCPQDRASDVDTLDALAYASTAGLLTGGVVLAAGLLTYLLAPSPDTLPLDGGRVLLRF